MNETIEFLRITPIDIAKWIVIAIIVLFAVIRISIYIYKYFEKCRNKMNEVEARDNMITAHDKDIKEIKETVIANKAETDVYRTILIEILHDQIDQRSRFYLSKGYVPEDEVEDYNRKFGIYQSIGGNHGLHKKVERVNQLTVLTEEQIIEFEKSKCKGN